MSDTEDASCSSPSGYSTPPLSPTKTISTEGWSSPRTPWSPRKTRSCLFVRDIQSPEPFYLTPPASPTKPKRLHGCDDLPAIRDGFAVHRELLEAYPIEPVDRNVPKVHARAASLTVAAENHGDDNHSKLGDDTDTALAPVLISPRTLDYTTSITSYNSKSSRSSSTLSVPEDSLHTDSSTTPRDGFENALSSCPLSSNLFNAIGEPQPLLRRLPVRCVSSPLRSSQWVTRGGMLPTPRKGQAHTPDRFIASRRPLTTTRESLELNKPNERLENDHKSSRGRDPGRHPFSRRLRRSGRLNEELRGLREAHSLITGRANALRRNGNLSYRRHSHTLGNRQVSAGAVWNVGGPSAVSDTVTGSSTGRGGIFSVGSMAPLHRSAFLSRADPQAEFEVYESRLALAMDIDQAERILQHSSTTTKLEARRDGDAPSQMQHT